MTSTTTNRQAVVPPGGFNRAGTARPATAVDNPMILQIGPVDKPLLRTILGKLDRGDAKENQWPDSDGEYWALCPFHADTHAGNFSVSERGFKCFSCGKSGGLAKLAEKLGIPQAEVEAAHWPATVENYAKAKNLPADFLEGIGLQTVYANGKQAIRMPYYDRDGSEVAVRMRIALTGEERFRWKTGSKLHPYGLWRLPKSGYVVVFEGESDTQTAWFLDLPALGIPGAQNWRKEWATYLDGLTVFLWQEPDKAGEGFVAKIGESLPDALVITPPVGRKDISECHLLGDDIPALIDRLRATVRPYREIAAERKSQAAAQAKQAAGSLLTAPDILGRFSDLCNTLGLIGEYRTAGLLYLAITSRLLDKPISVVVKGLSSGGKSYTVETVLKSFPESSYYALSSMSDRSLAYSDEPLSHRILVLFEAAGITSDLGTYLMRTLLSEGRIRYETVEKTAEGLKPKLIERDGPTGLIVTTTRASLHPENETRMLSVTVRDDREQTRGVLHSLADRTNGRGPLTVDLSPWHGLQTWLELAGSRKVSIPYAHDLAEKADPRAVRLRRDFGQVLNLVAAHAILHQATRQRDAYDRILATLDDYRAVHGLVIDIVSEGVQATVSQATRDTVKAVSELQAEAPDNKPVNYLQVANRLGLDKTTASRRAKVAIENGYLVNEEDRRGMPARLILGDPLPEPVKLLPSPEDLGGGEGMSIPSEYAATMQPAKPVAQPLNGAGGEGVSIPLEITATLQPVANERPVEVMNGVLVDLEAYADLLWDGLSIEDAAERARIAGDST